MRRHARGIAEAFARHDLQTHATAIAFRGLVALVPLTLLGLGLLGALGLEGVWEDTLAPAVRERVTLPVFEGIDFSVKRIFSSSSGGLIAFAAVLLVWDLAWGVRAASAALNAIYEAEEERPRRRIVLTCVALAVAIALAWMTSILLVAVLPRLAGGNAELLLKIVGVAGAAALLTVVVGLVVRYAPAPAGRRSAGWVSAGSLLVVGAWVGASLLFGWWAGSLADYKSAIGSLTMFLVLTFYVLSTSAIFLVGVQLDELARKSNEDREAHEDRD